MSDDLCQPIRVHEYNVACPLPPPPDVDFPTTGQTYAALDYTLFVLCHEEHYQKRQNGVEVSNSDA